MNGTKCSPRLWGPEIMYILKLFVRFDALVPVMSAFGT